MRWATKKQADNFVQYVAHRQKNSSMSTDFPALPDSERISTNIIRVMGGNPSKFALQGSNTYLVGRGPDRMLIDTGDGKKVWIDTLRDVLQSESATVSTCIITHWHIDHLGGVADLEALCPDVKVYKNQPAFQPDNRLDPARVHDIEDGQLFQTPGGSDTSDAAGDFEIQAIYTPGHAQDHMCFQITASPDPNEVGAMFTADNVLGHGTAVFENLMQYLDSLALMKRRVADAIDQQAATHGATVKRAYPGHGVVIEDAVAKMQEYLTHRRLREEEALNVLRYGTVKRPDTHQKLVIDSITRVGDSDSATESESETSPPGLGKDIAVGKEWESIEMVKIIYRNYPENLYEPAERGLLMVLDKLNGDGKVIKTPEGRWRAAEQVRL